MGLPLWSSDKDRLPVHGWGAGLLPGGQGARFHIPLSPNSKHKTEAVLQQIQQRLKK